MPNDRFAGDRVRGARLLAYVAGAWAAVCGASAWASPADDTNPILREAWQRLQSAWVPEPQSSLDRRVVTRAEPDECFTTIGGQASKPPCTGAAVPRTNQAYIFSAARSGDYVYFGTVANPVCLAPGAYFGEVEPFQSDNLVCEMAEGSSAVGRGVLSSGAAKVR